MSGEVIEAGDAVSVPRFSATGTVLSVDGSTARIQLRGGAIIRAAIAELRVACADDVAVPSSRSKITFSSEALDRGAPSLLSLDLHGRTTADAVELVEQRISQAVMAGMHEIEIVHGLGTGAVRAAIHQRLSVLGAVAKFELKFGNRGVTRVFLR
jgi:DNA mismatch repair protein MutS2